MTTIIEAIYEQGVLKPQDSSGLKEHHRYRVILQEIVEAEPPTDPVLAAELERRTTILPNGRKIIRLGGLFESWMPALPDDEDPIADAIKELRREREAHYEAELDPFFPSEMES